MEYIKASLIQTATDTMQVVHTHITPDIAEKWLGTQVNNRVLNMRAVRMYFADMDAGRWTFTADPIRFDTGGHLIDGQHRLSAIAMLDPRFEIEAVVALGLNPESQLAMDQGRRRQAGQQLGLAYGTKHSVAIAAGIRLLMRWDRGSVVADDGRAISTASIAAFLEENPESITLAQGLYARLGHIGIRRSAGMAFGMRTARFDPEVTELFFTELYELANQPQGSPLVTLNRRLIRARTEPTAHRLSEVDELGFLVYTWNNWLAGNQATRLQKPKGGWTKENFPVLSHEAGR